MNRRGFFKRLLGAALAPLVAKVLPKPPAPPLAPEELGLSIRFIRSFEPASDVMISRLDILYGIAPLHTEDREPPFFDPHLSPARLPA